MMMIYQGCRVLTFALARLSCFVPGSTDCVSSHDR